MDRKIEHKKWTGKSIAILGLSALFAIIMIYQFVFSTQYRKLNQDKEKISITTVKKGIFRDYIPVTGTVLPKETYYLDVVEGGRIIEKYVDEGTIVKAGTPLIRLENAQLTLNTIYNQAQVVQQENNLRSFRLQLEQNKLALQNQLLQLDVQLQNQKRIYNTNKALHDKKLVADAVFEESRDQFDFLQKSRKLTVEAYHLDSISRNEQIHQLESSVVTFQKNLKIIEEQFSNLVVKAPINGQLTALNAEIGKSISTGQNIGQIDNTDSYKVKIEIDEHYISRVKEGQFGECSLDGKTYKLQIKRVYVQVNGGKFQADMTFTDETPADLRRGQTFHIRLDLGGESDALLVDAGSFFQVTGGQWIFVLDYSGNTAEKRTIKIGRQNPEYFEVKEGLRAGDKVITSSYDDYKEINKLILN